MVKPITVKLGETKIWKVTVLGRNLGQFYLFWGEFGGFAMSCIGELALA